MTDMKKVGNLGYQNFIMLRKDITGKLEGQGKFHINPDLMFKFEAYMPTE